MNCPACGQPSKAQWNQDCPLCGFPLVEVNRRVFPIYIVTGAVFLSTVIYAGLVYIMSTTTAIRPNPAGDIVFYALAAMVVPVAIAMAVVKHIIAKAALAEGPAVYGIVAYFLTGDVAKFVILLGISWVLFIWLSTQIVDHVAQIQREAVKKWRSERRGVAGATIERGVNDG